MALNKDIHEALNGQLKNEFIAHFLYRAIALDLFEKGYDGFAAWMDGHATEEAGHAERIIEYLKDKNAKVVLPELPKPAESWAGVREAVAAALKHEQKLTADIHKLHKLAEDAGDLATVAMLDWFVSEQVEEEHIVTRLLKRIDLMGDSSVGLMVLDGQLTGSAPAAEASPE
jgi:ferritin